jgi:VWFA-related protein
MARRAALAASLIILLQYGPPPLWAMQPLAPNGVLWFIFIDDFHLDFRNTGHLRQLLEVISRELFQEGDELLAGSSGPSRLTIERTPDVTRLDAAKRTVAGNGLKPTDMVHADSLKELQYRAATSLSAACDAINRLEAIPGRRKAVIYISNGYMQTDMTTAEVCDDVPDVISAARRAGVRIFAIDGRLLAGFPVPDPNMNPDAWHSYWTSTQESLRMLSEETGGFAFLDSTDVEGALRNIRVAMY